MAVLSSPIRIVIAGGNFGGLGVAKSLYTHLLATNSDYDGTKQAPPNPNIQITLVDRRDGFVHYLGMTRGLSQLDYGRKLWASYSSMPWLQHPSFTVRKEIISQVTPQFVELAGSQERLKFDYLVLAMGVSRQAPMGVSASTKDEFIKELERDHAAIASAKSIAIVGGGAVGTELAADLKTNFPEKNVTLVHSRNLPVPGPFMEEFRQGAADILRKLGVRTLFGQRVVNEIPADTCLEPEAPEFSDILPELVDSVKRNVTIETASGEKIKADLVFNCLGAKTKAPIVNFPSSTDEPMFTPNGIRVKSSLQLDDPKYPHIFAVGDISNRLQAKFAGAAVYDGRVAGENIARLIDAASIVEGSAAELVEYQLPDVSMCLVLGEKHALIQGNGHVVPSEEAVKMCPPDIKLGMVMQDNYIGTYPVAMQTF